MAHFDDPATQQANMRYIRSAMKTPLLEREDELELARRWKENKDQKAMHKIINAHARMVVSMASKFKNYGLPMGDLIQEGNIGLMEAAARFEPDRENRFSTYAMWWIKAQIQDYVLRNWSIVRTGTTASQKSLFFNLRRLRARISGQSTKDYMDSDALAVIAKELNVTPEDVMNMEARMNLGDQSLSAPVNDDTQISWQDTLVDTSPTPEDIVISMKDGTARSQWLNNALQTLSPRERKIINDRQMSDAVVTLDDLGKELGISKERVRQLEKTALSKLKNTLLSTSEKTTLETQGAFM